jgi:hypothetical protein
MFAVSESIFDTKTNPKEPNSAAAPHDKNRGQKRKDPTNRVLSVTLRFCAVRHHA